jgi:hypothetical protein
MGYGCHTDLYHSTLRPSVTNLSGTSAEQAGNVTFHHRTTVATVGGQLYLIRGTFAVQARPTEEVEHL